MTISRRLDTVDTFLPAPDPLLDEVMYLPVN